MMLERRKNEESRNNGLFDARRAAQSLLLSLVSRKSLRTVVRTVAVYYRMNGCLYRTVQRNAGPRDHT